MKMINISKKKFDSLTEVELSRETFNTEGQMFNIKYKNKDKVLKRLYNDMGVTFANKLYTLEMLNFYKDNLPSNFVIPDYLESKKDNIICFTLTKNKGINLCDIINEKSISNKEKLYYYIKIGETLNQLKNIRKYSNLKEIYINDLHECNIMINPQNKELNIVDLDSSRILNNGCFASRYLGTSFLVQDKPHKYIYNENAKLNGPGTIFANENSDLYCYNIMILNYLYGDKVNNMNIDEFYNYLEYLNKIGIDKNLLDIFNILTTTADNKNPVNYLETITDTQIARSKKLVYECNKK